jgi:peptidoglycan hydrolase CwlO-like protein
MLPEIVIGVPVRETEVNRFVDTINEKNRMVHEYTQMIIRKDGKIDEQRKEINELQKEVELLKSRLNFFNCTSF